jgi:hypothetical protein
MPAPLSTAVETHPAWQFHPGLYAAGPDPVAWRLPPDTDPTAVVVVDETEDTLPFHRAHPSADVHRCPVTPYDVGALLAAVEQVRDSAREHLDVVVAGDEQHVAAAVIAFYVHAGVLDLPRARRAYARRGTGLVIPEDWRGLAVGFDWRHGTCHDITRRHMSPPSPGSPPCGTRRCASCRISGSGDDRTAATVAGRRLTGGGGG